MLAGVAVLRGKAMLKGFFRGCLIAGCFSLATFVANAQEVVHALTGTVIAINSAAKTIRVKTMMDPKGYSKF